MATAASASPFVFIPKFEPVQWKVAKAGPSLIARDYYGHWEFVTTNVFGKQLFRWDPTALNLDPDSVRRYLHNNG